MATDGKPAGETMKGARRLGFNPEKKLRSETLGIHMLQVDQQYSRPDNRSCASAIPQQRNVLDNSGNNVESIPGIKAQDLRSVGGRPMDPGAVSALLVGRGCGCNQFGMAMAVLSKKVNRAGRSSG